MNSIMRDIRYLCNSTSLERAYQYNGHATGYPEIDRLFFSRRNGGLPSSNKIADWFQFLGEPDALTDAIYGKPDENGNIIYPFAVDKHPDGIKEYVGPIGDQHSRWHLETLQEHVAMVTIRLIRAGLSETEAATLAVLHDIGKKYTAGTNKHGEVCFYGHATMGAILVAIQARCLPWFKTTWEHRISIGVVYGHTFPYSEWPGHPGKRELYFMDLIELFSGEVSFADHTMQLIETFNSADVGCTTPEELAEARKPGGIIEEGWALLMRK